MNNQGKHPNSSSVFWKRIKKSSDNKISIQTLESKGKFYKTDEEKAELFGQILGETFAEEVPNTNYNET